MALEVNIHDLHHVQPVYDTLDALGAVGYEMDFGVEKVLMAELNVAVELLGNV